MGPTAEISCLPVRHTRNPLRHLHGCGSGIIRPNGRQSFAATLFVEFENLAGRQPLPDFLWLHGIVQHHRSEIRMHSPAKHGLGVQFPDEASTSRSDANDFRASAKAFPQCVADGNISFVKISVPVHEENPRNIGFLDFAQVGQRYEPRRKSSLSQYLQILIGKRLIIADEHCGIFRLLVEHHLDCRSGGLRNDRERLNDRDNGAQQCGEPTGDLLDLHLRAPNYVQPHARFECLSSVVLTDLETEFGTAARGVKFAVMQSSVDRGYLLGQLRQSRDQRACPNELVGSRRGRNGTTARLRTATYGSTLGIFGRPAPAEARKLSGTMLDHFRPTPSLHPPRRGG